MSITREQIAGLVAAARDGRRNCPPDDHNYIIGGAIVALADDLADARALLERLDNAHAAESRQLMAEALEASRAFLERTR